MYRVIDEIAGEILDFTDSSKAQVVANTRLATYKKGFSMRRNYIEPINAIIVLEGKILRICIDKK